MPPRLRASAVYMLYFAALGSFLPYLNLYYESVGMTKPEIGILIVTLTLTTMLASPLWSALADSLRLHRFMLPLVTMGTLIPMAWLSRSGSFRELILGISPTGFLSVRWCR